MNMRETAGSNQGRVVIFISRETVTSVFNIRIRFLSMPFPAYSRLFKYVPESTDKNEDLQFQPLFVRFSASLTLTQWVKSEMAEKPLFTA